MFKKILVGTDGFGPASAAVKRAAELAKGSGAELVVLSAIPPAPSQAESQLHGGRGPSMASAEGILSDVKKRFGNELTLRTETRQGDPAELLVAAAEDEEADLIVVGNKGMTKRFHLGAVANQVSHHAPCNVLIVRTTD